MLAARILVVTNMYPTKKHPPSGVFVKEAVDMMKTSGLDVDVLFIRGRRTPFKYLMGIPRLWWLLLRNRYDLIHAYYVYSGFVARAQLVCPVILTLCGSDVNLPSQRSLSRLLSRLVSKTIVRTRRMKELLGNEGAIVMHLGVNLALVCPIPQAEARLKLGLPSNGKFALFPYDPSRKVKRHDLFSLALERARRIEPRLQPLVMKDLPKNLTPVYMSASDVLVMTSETEGSPNTIKEALACGLPIVSVDVGDVAELVEGVEGCFVCEANEDALAKGMIEALIFGRRTDGRERAKEISSEIMMQRLLDLYSEVLRGHERRASPRDASAG